MTDNSNEDDQSSDQFLDEEFQLNISPPDEIDQPSGELPDEEDLSSEGFPDEEDRSSKQLPDEGDESNLLPADRLCNRKGMGKENPIFGEGALGNENTGRMYYSGDDREKLVIILQRILKELGFDLGSTGPNEDGVDGNFGEKTEKAVMEFQKGHKDWDGNLLKTDGLVGPETSDALNRIMVYNLYHHYQTPDKLLGGKLCHTVSSLYLAKGLAIEPGKSQICKIFMVENPQQENEISNIRATLISDSIDSEENKWKEGALAGAKSMKNWTIKLGSYIRRYGIQKWYGMASKYNGWNEQQKRNKLQEWNRGKPERIPDDWPKLKGCYGWAFIHIKEVYLISGHIQSLKETIASGKSKFPTQLAAEMRKHGWKVIYYAARKENLPSFEVDEALNQRIYSLHRVPIDDVIVDFVSGGRGDNAINREKIQKLKNIPFYFGIESFYHYNMRKNKAEWTQGVHSWVGTKDKIYEFEWHINPNYNPIEDRGSLGGMLVKRGRGQGLLLVPPGMWPYVSV
jgi:hypothetical protein